MTNTDQEEAALEEGLKQAIEERDKAELERLRLAEEIRELNRAVMVADEKYVKALAKITRFERALQDIAEDMSPQEDPWEEP